MEIDFQNLTQNQIMMGDSTMPMPLAVMHCVGQ